MTPKEFLAEMLQLLREAAALPHIGERTDALVKKIDELAAKLDDVEEA